MSVAAAEDNTALFSWVGIIMYLPTEDPKERKEISQNIARCIKLHRKKTKRPIPQSTADIHTGLSWMSVCQMILRGDLKGRKLGSLYMRAVAEQKKAGVTIKDVIAAEKEDTSII